MAANQHEYYIRQPSDTEARGPFTFSQISALVDSGDANTSTLYFDAANEQWVPLAGSGELGVLLRNGASSRKNYVSAAASGNSAVGAVPANQPKNAARVLLLASAIVMIIVSIAIARIGGMRSLFASVFPWIAIVDVVLALVVGAVSVRAFTIVIRLRAALGLGFLGVVYWMQFGVPALVFGALALVCLWLTTVFRTRGGLFACAIAGLAACAGLAYCLLS